MLKNVNFVVLLALYSANLIQVRYRERGYTAWKTFNRARLSIQIGFLIL
jgi:hypothetical protein